MRPLSTLAATMLVAVVLVAACGSSPGGGGGGGGGGEVPPGGVVWFGTGYDPASFGVVGRATGGIKAGTPVAAVARLNTAREPANVRLSVTSGSTQHNNVAFTQNAQNILYAADLSGLGLTPTTWQVNFTDPQGRIIAAGFLQILP
jgi:hypothetical protein